MRSGAAGRARPPSSGSTIRGGLALAAAIALLILSGSRAGPHGAAGPANGRNVDAAAYSCSYPPERSGASTLAPASPAPSMKTTAATPAESSTDIETARAILAHHCGTCHTPGLQTTQAAALTIFSLADADWSARMTDTQICASGRRIKGTARNAPDEARIYTEAIGRLLQKRGAPPCGS